MPTLMTPAEVDRLLRYPAGRALELVKRGCLPFVRLPCGGIRFAREQIERVIRDGTSVPAGDAPVEEPAGAGA